MAQFEEWALVELFGHNRIAGKVTEAEIGGGKFIRIDVPALDGAQPLTRFYGPTAIYGITPLDEETALALAKQIKAAPVSKWEARQLLGERQSRRELVASTDDEDEKEEVLF